MKIWAKTMRGDKITRDKLFEKNGRNSKNLLEESLRELCESLDIPCPLLLKSHYENFVTFNTAKFLPADFVETIDFDSFVIENVTED